MNDNDNEDWFRTPARSMSRTPGPQLRLNSIPPPIQKYSNNRNEIEQAEIREERKKRKRDRKDQQQIKKSENNNSNNSSNKRKQPADGRNKVRKAKQREQQEIKSLEAGLNSSNGIIYSPLKCITNDGLHGIHRNIIGIVASDPKTKQAKTKDFCMNLVIADPSQSDSSKCMQVIFFSQTENGLPPVEPNHVILLRKAFIQRYQSKFQIVGRKGEYSWATHDPKTRKLQSQLKKDTLNQDEILYMERMGKWWKAINPDVIIPVNNLSGRKTLNICDIEERIFCNLIAEILLIEDKPPPGALEMLVTDYTRNEKLKETSINFLDHRVMKLSFYDNQREAARNLRIHQFAYFNNIRPKMSPAYLECNLGKDIRDNVQRLSKHDERLKPLLERKKEYDQMFGLPDFFKSQQNDQMVTSSNEYQSVNLNSSLEYSNQIKENENEDDNNVHNNENNLILTPKASNSNANKLNEKECTIPHTLINVDTYGKLTTIKNIIDNSSSVPMKYRIKAKVIDHSPPNIAEFTLAKCMRCDSKLSRNDKICTVCDDENIEHKYNFALLVEDLEGNVLPFYVYDEDGTEFFDGLEPQEVRTDKGLVKLDKKMKRLLSNNYFDFLIYSYIPNKTHKQKVLYKLFSTTLM